MQTSTKCVHTLGLVAPALLLSPSVRVLVKSADGPRDHLAGIVIVVIIFDRVLVGGHEVLVDGLIARGSVSGSEMKNIYFCLHA